MMTMGRCGRIVTYLLLAASCAVGAGQELIETAAEVPVRHTSRLEAGRRQRRR